jgi:hypothetical protein
MLRTTGSSLVVEQAYYNSLPSWDMNRDDQFYVADFDGNGRDDLFVFNAKNWATPYFGMLRSNGTSLSMARRYDNVLPDWTMRPQDTFFVADFDGDGMDEIYIFNPTDWGRPFVAMLRSTGSALSFVRWYDGLVPGWGLKPNDTFYVADVNGDNKQDLYVYNHADWDTEYLGAMISTGTTLSLTSGFQGNWIGGWNMGPQDKFLVVDFAGAAGWEDLFVFNDEWFGMLRSDSSSVGFKRIYNKWIHNYPYYAALGHQ